MCAVHYNSHRYLVFIIGSDEFVMPIKKIREIIGYVPLILFSEKQGVFEGAVQWHEELVPVVDLRKTLRDREVPVTSKTCILITKMPVDGEFLLAGLVVDGVCEVIEVSEELMSRAGSGPRGDHPFQPSWGSLSKRAASVYVKR